MKHAGIFLLGIFCFIAVLAMSSPAKAEPYPQIKLFLSSAKECKWVESRGEWIKRTRSSKMERCTTAIDKANAWLKEKGNSIQILSYQFIADNVMCITILWKDKPQAKVGGKKFDHKVDESNPFLPSSEPKKAKDKEEEEYEVQNPYK